MRKLVYLFLALAFITSSCRDSRIKEKKEWGQEFEKAGIKNACFILRDNNHESIYFYNKERCLERFTPASTFKIFNSLVALETAVATDDQLTLKWDGVARRPEWDKDMNMREAFKASCVWYYQELARRIGTVKYKHYLDTIKYGNMNDNGAVDMFWLNDTLKISADEQVGFVKRMYFNELPLTERSQRIVKTLMLQEETDKYNLYYKTGTGIVGNKTIYWVVGFVERIEHVKEMKGSMNKSNIRLYPYFFAQNFELPTSDTSKNWYDERIKIAKSILIQYGALPK